jgi:hypothetical protein
MRSALAGAGLGLLLGAAPAAGQGIPVTVGVGAVQTGAGAFDLPIMIDMSARTELLGSFALTVRWNPAVLQALGGVSGSFGDVTVNDDSLPAGILRMSGANPAGAGGLITLAVGRFVALTNDTTTFRVTVQELYAAGTFADLTADAVPLDRLFCGELAGRWGDVNDDGAVNGADALIVLTESVGLDVSQFAVGFGDVDSSGARDPRDALIILSFAVGIPTPTFRVGQSVGGNICTPPGAQSYGVNPAAAQALVGQAVEYYAFGLDSTGAALALRNVTWTTSDAGVATVDGAGLVTVLGAGTATISARQNDTTIASGTLTVAAARALHWVDALAGTARNQLGTAALPFGTLDRALGTAAAGDTLRVRSGRYAGGRITRRLTMIGDTTAGGRPPLFITASAAGAQDTVLVLDAAGRVELRDLRVDTAAVGVLAVGTDSVILRGVEVRGTANGIAGVRVQNARLAHLAQSRLVGTPSSDYYYYYAHGLAVLGADRVVVDTSLVSDFSYDGINAQQVDTVVVRGSTLRRNAGSGLALYTIDTAAATQLTFSRNRVEQNQYGGVTGYYVANVQFDRNVFVGGGYSEEGISLTGRRSTVASFVADSFDIRDGGWLYLSQFDSTLVDSVRVAQTDDYYGGGALYGGRVGVVRNSTFRGLRGTAVYFQGRGADSSTLVVRNAEFRGPTLGSSSSSYGYGVETYLALADVRDAVFASLYTGVYSYGETSLRIRASQFTDVGYGIQSGCLVGASTVDSVRMERVASYGVYAYGCGAGPSSIEVDSLDGTDMNQAAYIYGVRSGAVRRSRFLGVDYGPQLSGDTAVVENVEVTVLGGAGVYLYPDSIGSISGSTVTCASGAGGDGIEASGPAPVTIAGNTVTGDCDPGIYLASSLMGAARGNSVSLTGLTPNYGIRSWQGGAGAHAVVGNTVSGPYRYGAIYASSIVGGPTALRVDSNTVTNATEVGIWVTYGDTVLIQDNVVTGVQGRDCCQAYNAGILVDGYESQTLSPVVRVARNRLSGNERGLVLDRAFGDSAVVAVDTNRIVGSDTTGILVTNYSRILARANLVDATRAVGVLVDRFATPSPDDTLRVILADNNITGNGFYGVYNGDGVGAQTGLIDARNNWWGDADGPRGAFGNEISVTGDSVSQGVLWSPPLVAPAAVLPPAPPAFAVGMIGTPPSAPALRSPRPAAPTERPAGDLTEPVAPQPRVSGHAQADLLTPADRQRAERSAVRIQQLRDRWAARVEEQRRRAEHEAALEARRAARRLGEGGP